MRKRRIFDGGDMKLLITDLDGTLFDTKDVNYHAYKEAIAPYGYDMDYRYYCDFCNGRHYLEFLPKITTEDPDILKAMHQAKKQAYPKYLGKAILNKPLADLIRLMRAEYKSALVTTASRKNCNEILEKFQIRDLFDLVLTHEDIAKSKPDPEGFLKAMQHFHASPKETIIFEDSDVGLKAARRSGAYYYRTYGFN